ncbi:MAG TPA: hypothetical protein VE291_12970, partial [Terracidiphilus sp.]|nr:hypothetical protein [Terracidiphilus sp.]
MADAPEAVRGSTPAGSGSAVQGSWRRGEETVSIRELAATLVRRRRFVLGVTGGLLAGCVFYCLLWPRTYEACAQVALRGNPVSALDLSADPGATRNAIASDTQLETLANMLRSDPVAWRVIVSERLYQQKEFAGSDFARRFPGFRGNAPRTDGQAYLLEQFERHLFVRTLPRTSIVQIRFRSHDPALAATVANAVIRAYEAQQTAARVEATAEATGALGVELRLLKAKVDADNLRLIAFQKDHGLVDTPETLAGGEPGEAQHNPTLVEIDALGQELVAAKADRIQKQAEYEAAVHG